MRDPEQALRRPSHGQRQAGRRRDPDGSRPTHGRRIPDATGRIGPLVPFEHSELGRAVGEPALSADPAKRHHLEARSSVVTHEITAGLEQTIDELDEQVESPRAFVVPGASPGSAALDLARSLLRTTERRVVELKESGKLANPEVLRYLNRLSDLLFVLARFEDRDLPLELATGDEA